MTLCPDFDSSDDWEFDLTDPDVLRSQGGRELPPPEPFEYLCGTRHPMMQEISPVYCQTPRTGSMELPGMVLLANTDPANALQRGAFYGVNFVFQDRERCVHTMALGPSGGGKNVTVIDPLRMSSIRDANQTTIVFSLKAGDYGPIEFLCRRFGKNLSVVNLCDPYRSVGWNPLETSSCDEAYHVIALLLDALKNPLNRDSEFFQQWVRKACFGAWLAGYRSFPAIAELFGRPTKSLIDELKSHDNESSRGLGEFLAGGSHNAETVLASITASLSCFLPAGVRHVMSNNRLRLERALRTPGCILVELPESRIESHRPLVQLLARLIIDALVQEAEERGAAASPATIFFDDLPSMGNLLTVEKLLTLRSRRIGIVAGVQSLTALDLVYGPTTRAVVDGFGNKIVLPGVGQGDAEYFACSSGDQTVSLESSGHHPPQLIRRSLLSAADIRCPSYSHPLLGKPATLFLPGVTVQAYLQKSYEIRGFAEALRAKRSVTGRERLRRTRLRSPKQGCASRGTSTGPLTDARGLSDAEIRALLEAGKVRIGIQETTGSALKFWQAFEVENKTRLPLVLRLVEELANRNATITEFFLCYVSSNTDNIQANLHYLDFSRLKKAEDQKQRKAGRK